MLNRSAATWFRRHGCPCCIFAIVVCVTLSLALSCHWERWSKALPALGRPATDGGAGLMIRSDGLGYYAWLRSLLIDGDWDFDNEFDEHNVVGDFVPAASDRTTLGRRSNPWSVGPACVWAVTVAPLHALLLVCQQHGCPWPADGYSLPYQLAVGGTTFLATCLGWLFLFGIGRQFTSSDRAALVAALLTLGTTIVYYNAIEVSMAHGIGTAVVAALVWYWLRSYGQPRFGRWFLVGLLVGATALVRWQLVTLALLPFGEAVLTFRRYADWKTFARLGLAGLGAVLAFLPQLLAWKVVYGEWLARPIAPSDNWLRPAIGTILWGQDRGLFSWTPLSALAFVGLLVSCLSILGREHSSQPNNRTRTSSTQATLACASGLYGNGAHRHLEPPRLLAAAFFLQVYVLASLWGAGVYLGVAFGMRHLTEVQVLLAPGLAVLLERTPKRAVPYLAALACLLVAWNLLLVEQFWRGLLPADAGTDLETLIGNGIHLFWRKPLAVFGPVVLAPLLLWLMARSGERRLTRPNPSTQMPLTQQA